MNETSEAFQHLLLMMDNFIINLDMRHREKLAIRDRKLERLVAWTRKVSEKTGVPPEGL